MKNLLLVILLAGSVSFYALASAKSGPVIPNPQITAAEAVNIAQDFFYSKETRIIDGETFKLEDYVLVLAQYTNDFNDKADNEWGWKIKFQHLAQNDHSLVYKISDDGKVIFLYATE
ncbi:MAG TPA: hypothetical protein PLJ15_02145 [Candidatus Omnitrophota bacterium]|nr:hypothetical protein [Candidatus Omnitrophota bacterium]